MWAIVFIKDIIHRKVYIHLIIAIRLPVGIDVTDIIAFTVKFANFTTYDGCVFGIYPFNQGVSHTKLYTGVWQAIGDICCPCTTCTHGIFRIAFKFDIVHGWFAVSNASTRTPRTFGIAYAQLITVVGLMTLVTKCWYFNRLTISICCTMTNCISGGSGIIHTLPKIAAKGGIWSIIIVKTDLGIACFFCFCIVINTDHTTTITTA